MKPQRYTIQVKEVERMQEELIKEEGRINRLLQAHQKYQVWSITFVVLALFWFGFTALFNSYQAFIPHIGAMQIVIGGIYNFFGGCCIILAIVSLFLFFTAENPNLNSKRSAYKQVKLEMENQVSYLKKELEKKKQELQQAEKERQEMQASDEIQKENIIPMEELFIK